MVFIRGSGRLVMLVKEYRIPAIKVIIAIKPITAIKPPLEV